VSQPALDACGATHVGKLRKTNEDSYLIGTLQRSVVVHDASPGASGWFAGEEAGTMLVVADGLGGQGGGDVASRVAVGAVVNHLLNCMPWTTVVKQQSTHGRSLTGIRDQLANALADGDSTVRVTGQRTGTPAMGTTLTIALVMWPFAYIAHVGDTRCYLYRSGELRRLTTDHTLAQKLSEDSAEVVDADSRLHHILWNSLGASADLPKPELRKLTLKRGDALVLCSDGLNKHVTDEQIAAVLATPGPAKDRCRKLVDAANAAGGTDNITVLIAQFADGA
jgi:serine/threonine protein phosphatase PrpC